MKRGEDELKENLKNSYIIYTKIGGVRRLRRFLCSCDSVFSRDYTLRGITFPPFFCRIRIFLSPVQLLLSAELQLFQGMYGSGMRILLRPSGIR